MRKNNALSALLIACLRTSPKWIFSGYKLQTRSVSSDQPLIPTLADAIPNALNEILVFRCYLADKALWEVMCKRKMEDKNLSLNSLHSERFAIMDKIVDGALDAYAEFRKLSGTGTRPGFKCPLTRPVAHPGGVH